MVLLYQLVSLETQRSSEASAVEGKTNRVPWAQRNGGLWEPPICKGRGSGWHEMGNRGALRHAEKQTEGLLGSEPEDNQRPPEASRGPTESSGVSRQAGRGNQMAKLGREEGGREGAQDAGVALRRMLARCQTLI